MHSVDAPALPVYEVGRLSRVGRHGDDLPNFGPAERGDRQTGPLALPTLGSNDGVFKRQCI